MAIRCGIVGLPNVGKSTLFNALTAAEVPAENYPFCTIDPNVGIVVVPDKRLEQLNAIVRRRNIVPATVEFVDIAGLVAGASEGEGLGNRFLANIRETHAIAHVVRCFANDDVTHVAGDVDPGRDIGVINTELVLADLETADRNLEKAERQAKTANKDDVARRDFLKNLVAHLDTGAPARRFTVPDPMAETFRELHLITAKPVLYVVNVDESGLSGNEYVEQVEVLAEEDGAVVMTVCAALEAEIAVLDAEDRQAFLEDLGLEEQGLSRVIRAAYQTLGLQTFFTVGENEVRAWTTPVGATAPQAAGEIHTDFQRGFIRAEVISFDDYMAGDGERGAREAGSMRLEGKDYVVQEGDVIYFRFNV